MITSEHSPSASAEISKVETENSPQSPEVGISEVSNEQLEQYARAVVSDINQRAEGMLSEGHKSIEPVFNQLILLYARHIYTSNEGRIWKSNW